MAIHQDHEIQEFSEFLPKIRDYSGSFRLGSRADAKDACSRPSSFINLPLVAVMDRQGAFSFLLGSPPNITSFYPSWRFCREQVGIFVLNQWDS